MDIRVLELLNDPATRGSAEEEELGLDLAIPGERAYDNLAQTS